MNDEIIINNVQFLYGHIYKIDFYNKVTKGYCSSYIEQERLFQLLNIKVGQVCNLICDYIIERFGCTSSESIGLIKNEVLMELVDVVKHIKNEINLDEDFHVDINKNDYIK